MLLAAEADAAVDADADGNGDPAQCQSQLWPWPQSTSWLTEERSRPKAGGTCFQSHYNKLLTVARCVCVCVCASLRVCASL